MLKWDLPIPWKESNVRELLNRLRAQEVTPHKLQLCWDTLRWFAKKFGLLAVQEEHRLEYRIFAKDQISVDGISGWTWLVAAGWGLSMIKPVLSYLPVIITSPTIKHLFEPQRLH